MADLFLSYPHADAARARQIVDALEARGLLIWWDSHLEYGKDFRAGIIRQIREASCVVVLWSRASLASAYVVAEATEGMEQGKLLPVLLERNLKLPLGLGPLSNECHRI